MALFERIETPTLRGRIAEKIRRAILDGTIQPGSKMVERQLAAQFATSLTAVREALIVLEAEGFVAKKPNTATHVTELTLTDTEQLFDVRRVLERYAVELAARKCTASDAESLDTAYLSMLDAARAKQDGEFVRADLALHERIWEVARNEYLQASLRRINIPLFAFVMIHLVTERSALDLAHDAESHTALLNAIKANRPERACQEFDAAVHDWLVNLRREVFGQGEAARSPGRTSLAGG
ncbi:MAG: GntR family transcriptional regulator [Bryobacterales bacterium]|nr:GntR family transcriptional regulator [Bryobacterales bacterium]